MARVLPWLICAATLLLASTKSSTALRMAKPGCRETCGDLTIPYPFGIGPGCFYSQGFDVSCENNLVYMHNSSSRMQIYNISLLGGQARVSTLTASKCFYSNDNNTDGWASASTAHFFTISSNANRLTVVGCNTLAFLGGYNKNSIALGAGCFSMCADKQSVDRSGQCSGMGCCQTSIAPNLSSSNITFDERFDNSEVRSFNPCSYAFVAEQDWFRFEASYLENNKFTEKFKDGVPAVLDWVVGIESCDKAVKNMSSYACISKNSHCTMSPNATGYLCTCNDGFAGNPYLEEGCQDIDECSSPDQYPCHGICSNIIGNYSCSCPSGTRSIDPKRETCNPIATLTKAFIGLLVGLAVGGGISLICLVPGIIFFMQKLKARQAKRLRAKYFEQNRGLLLQQLVDKDIAERMIFSLEELEKATNKFDEARKLGGGGHGTVYKGILSNQDVVAIKKSKITIQREIEDFINEVAILSQINHRNVVRLFGCCLETQVPLLVYEFISNGTLSDYLHVEGPLSLSWGDRLRIALETASALAYLHSSTLTSIIHRDVKSANILLDHRLIAKVSDFGASRGIPIDQTGVTTAIQGTFGYLDPEYYQTSRLTDKSDVYGFGVILVELLTRKKPSAFMHSEGVSLIAQFNLVISQDRLCEILDPQVISECLEGAKEVAALASTCLNLKGEERPTMRQVEMALEMLLVANKSTGQGRSAELNCTPAQISNNNDDNSRQYSTEQELLLSASFPR